MPKQALDHSGRPGDPADPPQPAGPISVRQLQTHQEFVECVDLQHAVWGANFSERVPAALLKVAQRIGGVAAGAFDRDQRLIGFVFGLTGVENGRLVHWSDMLAVRADMRDHGIGRHLKEFQRDLLRQIGVGRIYWTFDPLVARNAHLNLNRLGAHVVEYIPDMYGAETSSVLHRGLGTDRFVVAWDIDRAAPTGRDEHGTHHPPALRASPILNPLDPDGLPMLPDFDRQVKVPSVRIAIPLAIDSVQAQSLPAAARWRASTRRAILWSLDKGYHAAGFYRDDDAQCGFYICSLAPAPAAGPAPAPFHRDQ